MKYFVIVGVIGLILIVLSQSFILSRCDNMGCLFLIGLFALPGLLIQDAVQLSLVGVKIINSITYFLIGGVIGLIVYKIKNKTWYQHNKFRKMNKFLVSVN